jgi:hypothetical protein
MGRYLAAAEAICAEFGCVVIIVHHCGIDGTRPRGHTSLTGAANVQIAVRRDAANNVIVEVEFMKDGPEGATFTSRLELIEVGTDIKTGKPITSCNIVPVETASAGKRAGARLTANQRRFLDIVNAAIRSALPEHKKPDILDSVSREWLKECCIQKGWLDEADSNPRQKIANIINALAGKRLIGVNKLYVWSAP